MTVNEKVPLHEVCDIGNGYAFKSTEFQSVGTPLLRISNINNNRVSFGEGTAYVAPERLETHSAYVVNNGDVVIALSGATTGKYGVYLHDTPCLLNQRIGIIRKTPSDTLYLRYFYFYLNVLRSEILRKAEGAAQPNISTKEIGQFKIPLPPLAEQKKIAAILDAADQLRQKDQQLIDHCTALSQSLFLEMFGDPVSNLKQWKLLSLGELCEFENGDRSSNYPSKLDIQESGKLFLSSADIKHGYFEFGSSKFISNSKYRSLKRGKCRRGDVLMTLRGNGLGRTCVFECEYDEGFINAQMVIIRPDTKKVTPRFLVSQLNHDDVFSQLLSHSSGSAQPQFSAAEIKKFKVLVPPGELQEKFERYNDKIDVQKRQVEANMVKSESLFNSLLQKAFKGELTSTKVA